MAIKIFIPRPNEDWIVDSIISDFCEHTKHEIVNSITKADVVWLAAAWIFDHFDPQILADKVTLTTIHHRTPWKMSQWLEPLRKQEYVSKEFHVPCGITKKYLENFIKKPITILPYWVNNKRYFAMDKNSDLVKNVRSKLFSRDDVTIISSFQRDSEGNSGGAPKIEKGPDIFCSIIEKLSKIDSFGRIGVLLTGIRREYVINRLSEFAKSSPGKISITYTGSVSYSEINLLYNCTDYYLVTSRVEGGPQALFESGITGTKLLTTKVGSYESVDPYCWCGNEDEFVEKIQKFDLGSVDRNMKTMNDEYLCGTVIPKYDDWIETTYRKYRG